MAVLKLLVVEDDIANLELMTELLEQLGAQVRPIGDSQEAARLLTQENFDVAFLDLTMPGITGFELARIIRDSVCNRNTPVVIVTGQEEKDTMHLSFSVGATYFIQKPINSQKLAELLQQIKKHANDVVRSFSRVSLNVAVTCIVGDRQLEGLAWNVSQGGIQVEANGLKIGDVVRMSFILPQGGTVIKSSGVVIWENEGRYGLNFTEMSLEHQEAIRSHVLRG